MLMLFDFKCHECGHEEEKLVDSKFRGVSHPCSVCDGVSTRVISPVRSKLDGTDPGFPDAYDKWARDHEKAGRQSPKE